MLLLGIRDLNDQLVADSLRALAEVVPILGASKVIGKNRRKIFSDGAPGKVKNRIFSDNRGVGKHAGMIKELERDLARRLSFIR